MRNSFHFHEKNVQWKWNDCCFFLFWRKTIGITESWSCSFIWIFTTMSTQHLCDVYFSIETQFCWENDTYFFFSYWCHQVMLVPAEREREGERETLDTQTTVVLMLSVMCVVWLSIFTQWFQCAGSEFERSERERESEYEGKRKFPVSLVVHFLHFSLPLFHLSLIIRNKKRTFPILMDRARGLCNGNRILKHEYVLLFVSCWSSRIDRSKC